MWKGTAEDFEAQRHQQKGSADNQQLGVDGRAAAWTAATMPVRSVCPVAP